jgi:homoserine dehydrogenase
MMLTGLGFGSSLPLTGRAWCTAKADGALAELKGVERWPTALDGLRETETDVLVEVSQSPVGGEPGLSHMREALGRGIAVATSNKWPVALAGVQLSELARGNATLFRAESTVMSGTPVLSTLTEGIAGATPVRIRGVVNATVNFVCSRVVRVRRTSGRCRLRRRSVLPSPIRAPTSTVTTRPQS